MWSLPWTGEQGSDPPRNSDFNSQSVSVNSFPPGISLLQGESQLWLHVGNLFVWLALIIIIILSSLPGGPYPSAGLKTKVFVQLRETWFVSAHLWIDEIQFSSVQSLSCVQHFANPWTTAYQAYLSITNCWSLLKLMSIESVMPSNHLISCCPLLLPPSIFPQIRVFSNRSVLHTRWPKYWSFSFSISTSNEYSGLISFRMDWLGLLAVQGTLKTLLQHHSSRASILRCSAFFIPPA